MKNKMNFNKKFNIYNENALSQKKVAKTLMDLIDTTKFYDSILELGCGTGIFTKTYYNVLNFNRLDLNDIFDTTHFFSNIKYNHFYISNMEELDITNYALILSSSAFQWVENLENLIFKLSQNSSTLAFSIYSKGNLIEIFNHFKITLNYYSTNEIYNILNRYYKKIIFKEQEFKISFETPTLALKHLKNTGVTGFSTTTFHKIKTFKDTTLTYKISYFVCEH